MPVTITPASIIAQNASSRCDISEPALLKSCCSTEYSECKEPIASSFSSTQKMLKASNGLVDTITRAYNKHHHLTIRPEDVWLSIVAQFTHFVNAHAEEMRSKFISQEGQEHIIVRYEDGKDFLDHGNVFATLSMRMAKELERRVTEANLLEWIMPSFSTTTKTDEVVASVIMMGTLQKYHTYEYQTRCGLPSVTLLGEKSDWENILNRLDTLLSFGKEPSQWYKLLKPVIARFIRSFDAPDPEATKEFWRKIVHVYENGSGPRLYTGWITAFMFWEADGK